LSEVARTGRQAQQHTSRKLPTQTLRRFQSSWQVTSAYRDTEPDTRIKQAHAAKSQTSKIPPSSFWQRQAGARLAMLEATSQEAENKKHLPVISRLCPGLLLYPTHRP